MGRTIDVDEFKKCMTHLAEKAHNDGFSESELAYRMATLIVEQYVSIYGVKEKN